MVKSMKKKMFFSISFIGGIVLVFVLGSFFIRYGKILKLKKYYSKNVVVTRNTSLYSNSLKEIGKISKGVPLVLEEMNDSSYFQIEDTDYYVYYQDVEKLENFSNDSNDYLPFNQNIHTSKETILQKDGEEVITVEDEMSLPIQYMDDEYYYVSFFENDYQIKKTDGVVEEAQNTEEEEASFISVIYFDGVSDEQLKEDLDYLRESHYQTISLDEYQEWLDGKIRLKKESILLTTSENVDNDLLKNYSFNIENISSNEVFSFIDANMKTTKDTVIDSINRYLVTSEVSIGTFQKMVLGESIDLESQDVSNFQDIQGVSVLNYHFFYDARNEVCDESICLDVSKFEEQLAYLKENGYKALTMTEFKKWMRGEIDVPLKSVLITIDDGAMGTGKLNGNKLIPLLEKYKIHATLFLITAWWDKKDYESDYLEIESHGDDLHIVGDCGKNKIYCLSQEEILKDLTTSISKLGTNQAFCYPFYSYSDSSIDAIKAAGFSLAFIGGSQKAYRTSNPYLIPRYPIQKDITLEEFIRIIS